MSSRRPHVTWRLRERRSSREDDDVRLPWSLCVLLVAGCYNSAAFDALQGPASDSTTNDDASSSTAGSPASTSTVTSATGSGGEAETTTTGEVETDSGSDSHDGNDPILVELEVTPPFLEIAGPVELHVEHDLSVVKLELWDELYDDPRFEWSPKDPAPDYILTQGQGETRFLTVRAYDDEGNFGVSNVATVGLAFPDPGTKLWEHEVSLGDITQGRAVASGDLGGAIRLFTGFDSDSAALIGRYTSTGSPALHASIRDPLSTTTGIAVTPDGSLLASGVDLIDGKNRSWLARVNTNTADVEYLFQGKLGDTATGLAYDHDAGRVYLSGYAPRGLGKPADARIWALDAEGTILWTQSWERPDVEMNEAGVPTDEAYAVAVLDDGDTVIVGESRYKPNKPELPKRVTAFVLRYDPNGSLDEDNKVWISKGEQNFAGAYAVAADDNNGLLVAGWSSPDAEQLRQALVLTFDEFLTPSQIHTHGLSGERVARAVARLHSGAIVYAADTDVEEENRHDFEVRAINASFGPPLWSQIFAGAQETRAAAMTVTDHGHIIVVGTKYDALTSSMLLAGIHP